MLGRLNGVNTNNNNVSKEDTINKKRELRAKSEYVVDKDTTIAQLAKKFGMSPEAFKEQTGLKNSQIKAGQVIKNIPTAKIGEGKGLTSLAREYGMSLADFCELNGIDKTYSPQKGEFFYVKLGNKQKSENTQSNNKAQETAQTAKPEEKLDNEALAEINKIKTPAEIAKALYDTADSERGAVGKSKFDAIFDKLNKNNINEVLKEYKKISPDETLINTISSEWSSDKEVRKSAMTKIYDLLSEKAGASKATDERRESFLKELNDEFNSFGTVSTKKLDKMIFNMSEKTPTEIASALKNAAKTKGCIEKDDFKMSFADIDKNNVIEVLKEYDKIKGNGLFADSSLLDTIASEWSSSKESRKEAMTKIYDLVAQKVGSQIATPEKREEFIEELNAQFDSFGTVSTKKLDKILLSYIYPNGKPEAEDTQINSDNEAEKRPNTGTNALHLSGKAYPNEIFYSTNGGHSKDITPTTMTSIKDKEGNYVNAGTLKSWALSSGKKDIGFKDVKDPFIVRPLPNYNSETKKIEAVTEVLDPIQDGNLSGKVVVLNPGHGGYQQKNGYFDAGTVLSVKNAQGEEMPIEEWRVAQSYVEKMSDNLRERGAKVIIVSGAVKNGGMAKQRYLEEMFAGNKGSDDVREVMQNTDKKDLLFLSVHVESAKQNPGDKKCTVRHTKGIDKQLADNINKYVSQGFMSLTPDVEPDNLYVNRASKGIPSSLLEIGNIANEEITNSLLSEYDQKKYAECIANAIEATLLDERSNQNDANKSESDTRQ